VTGRGRQGLILALAKGNKLVSAFGRSARQQGGTRGRCRPELKALGIGGRALPLAFAPVSFPVTRPFATGRRPERAGPIRRVEWTCGKTGPDTFGWPCLSSSSRTTVFSVSVPRTVSLGGPVGGGQGGASGLRAGGPVCTAMTLGCTLWHSKEVVGPFAHAKESVTLGWE